jgi:hypothetical protein
MLASIEVDDLLIMATIICFMLAPAALVWWEVASTRKRLRVRYRLSTVFVVVGYVAVVLAVIRWLGVEGEDVLVVALLVAIAMAVLWLLGFAVADIVHPKRVAKRRDRPGLQQQIPALPPQPPVATAVPDTGTTPRGERPKRRRRKHWWAKGLKRVNYGRYGLWKDGGPSTPT